ncbi:DUF2202 domain-containing protein [Sulfurovum sp. zt1-1]|uniref:DUF2202 domain-containing protein n=1 Tax=Sulfurovum zhangzhouensis TaxID=3019067 RepID=A0ABT7QVN3_9BACT|nr:DUF2202 domain-containing protein [Sulfurovum zhangzhouensis]MDM5270903.1 DUF2202 domain-containing protein [Sulfurovum zhangzhouensis]
MEVKGRRNFLSKVMLTSIGGAALLSTSANAKSTQNQSLTEVQKDKLFFIYQEEKVARDVYITLGNIYTDENTFASIQISEQRHMDSARELCEKYGVDISNVDESQVGEFVLPVLQELYDTCVSTGEESILDALKIGELIELTDIDDLEDAAQDMPSDVITVFESLKEGSYNHLDAFQTAIARA